MILNPHRGLIFALFSEEKGQYVKYLFMLWDEQKSNHSHQKNILKLSVVAASLLTFLEQFVTFWKRTVFASAA